MTPDSAQADFHPFVPLPTGSARIAGTDGTPRAWNQLRYLNYYRLGLAAIFVSIGTLVPSPDPLGLHNFSAFYSTSIGYLLLAVSSVVLARWRTLSFDTQVYVNEMIDIGAITVVMHASGGVSSGLGLLLVIAIAGGSLMMAGQTARLFAAIATLAVFAESIVSRLEGAGDTVSYTHAGLLGASFFATAILGHSLAKRLRESEALAERRGIDLANMAQLTEYIIQRMQTGIMVVDSSQRIRLINESAQHLLEAQSPPEKLPIAKLSPALALQLEAWWLQNETEPQIFRPSDTAPEISPRFARLGTERDSGTLIFLEDTSAMAQQAQQLKLASLGRLTASIAHEVRNPLGAISHAGQLLAESTQLNPADLRLIEIILEHSRRVNKIIENIMKLSRRDRAHPEELALKPWLNQFVREFTQSEAINPAQIRLQVAPEDLTVRFDPGQLRQILINLCRNGLRHGAENGLALLEIHVGNAPDARNPFLDIIDNGNGIAADTLEHVFEPFFTTASEGTGMGLYIARELCESNQARLSYINNPGSGAHFRITFADPRRRQVA